MILLSFLLVLVVFTLLKYVVLKSKFSSNLVVLSTGTFSLLQNIVCCHRQAFKLTELFIGFEDNQTTMPLYVY